PDYIDPSYHAVACARPSTNLDAVLCGADLVRPLFAAGVGDASVAVVEGVMGLYDGRGATRLGSTAHAAELLGAPVILVVDASSMSRSIAALVHGFATFEPGMRLAGVIVNRVASHRHEQLIRESLEETGVPLVGLLRRDTSLATPSRHLGLVPAGERAAAAASTVGALAAAVAQGVDLQAVLAIARSAAPLTVEAWTPDVPDGRGLTVAVAGGPAFTFRYGANVGMLFASGAEVVEFDPLTDESLPDGANAVVIGGGFPETYADELSANAKMRAQVHDFAVGGGKVYAECAGLLYLARTLDGHEMCDVVPTDALMTPTLSLGYRDAVGIAAGIGGVRVTGHVHHRTACAPPAGLSPVWRLDGQPAGFAVHQVLASYLHLHFAGAPEIPRWLLETAGDLSSR
ncbi:MAG: cobyrinic acid a,c-diamide synthase, partial [Frankiales bacterium]|nr:cobyrinic acid a,c-diamide synthase [Frankiales bacterium]